jgi:hypothetical protein
LIFSFYFLEIPLKMSIFMKESDAIGEVNLKCSDDWENWELQFKGLAVSENLWEYIKGTKVLLTEPIPPAAESFRRPGSTTRSQGPSSDDDPFANMTNEGQKGFQLAWAVYLDQKGNYKTQHDGIRTLRYWIRKTVLPTYQSVCCEPEESVKDWYDKLKELVSTEETVTKKEIRNKYRQAIKSPSNLKSLPAWIDNWEQVMSQAKKKNLAVAENPLEWFDDCLTAMDPLLPHWVEAYRITKETEVENDDFSYRTLANAIREVARRKVIPSRTKIAKGSFGPTFADHEDQCAGVNEPNQGDDAMQSKGKQKRKATKKRRRSKDKSPSLDADDKLPSSSKVCRGCNNFHHFQQCFYLFPEKAPRWFIERAKIREVVNQSLKDDPCLAEEVKRLRKKMDKDTGMGRKEDDPDEE